MRPGHGAGPDTVEVDLSDVQRLSDLAASVDAVVHCAASDDPRFLPISRQAALSMVRALPPGGAFAMHGGSMVFGDTGPSEATVPNFAPPPPLKARAAFDSEILGAGGEAVRPFVVYGSFVYGGEGAMIPKAMIGAAMQADAALYFDEGQQVWSTVHVDDFGALLVDAVENGPAGGRPLFAAGRPVQLAEAAQLVADALGVPARPARDDEEALFGPFGPAMRMSQHFSSDGAREHVGWQPKISDETMTLADDMSAAAARASL